MNIQTPAATQNSLQHLWTWLSGKKTYLITLTGLIYAWGIDKNLWPHDLLLDFLLGGGVAAALRHGWKTEAAKIVQAVLLSPPQLTIAQSGAPVVAPVATSKSSQSGRAHWGLLLLCTLGAAFLIGAALLSGCANLQPGADPFVVRIEQAQSSAKPGFDFVLQTENLDRNFWKQNSPAFYNFCEWLRQPQPVHGPTAFGTNISMDLPRSSAMQWNLDQIKQSYKAGKATSNEVLTVLTTLQEAFAQTTTWSTMLTNSAHR